MYMSGSAVLPPTSTPPPPAAAWDMVNRTHGSLLGQRAELIEGKPGWLLPMPISSAPQRSG